MTKIKRIRCGNGNCFLVYRDERAVLIDTGRKVHRDKIIKECSGKNVGLIILTHGHIDHVANVAFLSKKFGCPIAMHRKDYKLIQNNLSEPMEAHSFLGKAVLALSIKSFREEKIDAFEPSIYLKEGDELLSYGIGTKVIELPGHTEGSIGILVQGEELIVGDALMNLIYPTKSMLYGSYNHVKKSAEVISNSKARVIHFGHGKSLKNRKW